MTPEEAQRILGRIDAAWPAKTPPTTAQYAEWIDFLQPYELKYAERALDELRAELQWRPSMAHFKRAYYVVAAAPEARPALPGETSRRAARSPISMAPARTTGSTAAYVTWRSRSRSAPTTRTGTRRVASSTLVAHAAGRLRSCRRPSAQRAGSGSRGRLHEAVDLRRARGALAILAPRARRSRLRRGVRAEPLGDQAEGPRARRLAAAIERSPDRLQTLGRAERSCGASASSPRPSCVRPVASASSA